ncbi:galectin-3 isoform 2-T2 [Polymixia lowei]
MADFSLADAILDDVPGQANKTANTNPSAPANNPPPASNPGWPGSAPGAPSQPSAPGGQPGGGNGMYGPGGPGAFPPAAGPGPFPGFPGGAFPPMPTGSWGPPGDGGFPPAPGPFGPGPMGPYGGPAAPGGMLMVPYDLPLHAGMMPRLLITIVGEPIPGGDRFHVDFVRGQDVVFHFNPRFHEQTIVRNSNLGGCWGPEEREGGFPFAQGRRFELKILVEEDMFKVAVDGNHLLEFEHRVGGLEDVTLLRVVGDVTLYSAAPSMI